MNKKAVSGIVLMLLLTSMLSSAFIIQPVKASIVILTMDNLPEKEGWKKQNDGGTSWVSDGILTIDSPSYFEYSAPADWINAVSNERGWIIETRMRIDPSTVKQPWIDRGSVLIWIHDNTYLTILGFDTDKIYIAWPDAHGVEFLVDTTDEFHVYRIEGKESSFKVFVDGDLAIDYHRSWSGEGTNALVFGDGVGGYYSKSYWDYFLYDTTGIEAEPRTWTVDDDLQDRPDADFTKIQDAVDASTAGDIIIVYRGVYTENVFVNKRLTIKSESGAEETIVQSPNPELIAHVFDVSADYVNISGFTVKGASGNYECGLFAEGSNCRFYSNRILDNNYGIWLEHSNNTVIVNNDISRNGWTGVHLRKSHSNTISGNVINSNPSCGIYLDSSSGNVIVANNITSNNWGGLVLVWATFSNLIYSNNFNNTVNVELDRDLWMTDIWDNGYPIGGNYWSDYEEKYPDAEELDDSGIWDTPYVIDENNQDNYPLMEPWTPASPEVPDNFADLGNLTDEATHNLKGWGAAQGPPENQGVSPSGDRTKRYQLLRGNNSLDLMVDKADVPYFLTAEVEDGICTDNFEIYVNGEGPVYEYTGKNVGTGPVTAVSHQVLVPAEYITARRVTITFRNTATDDCGLAAVYNVRLTPTPPPKFKIGDWVQTTANLNVREGPGLSYTINDTMPLGTIGQILGGPVEADGFVWWDVDYAVGVRGWSVQNWLELAPPNQPPDPPTLLNQCRTDGIEISVGEITVEDSVAFKGVVSDPDGDQVKLQVELRRLGEYGGEFDETKGGFKNSSWVKSGSEATAYAFELIDGEYHWRARTVDEHEKKGNWADFGENSIYWRDFAVDTTPPETYILYGPSGTIHDNDVTFTCHGWDTVTPFYELRYSYYLEGDDSDWSDWTYSDQRSYTDLPNGKYTFKVRTKDHADHVDLTPEERSFTVSITGPHIDRITPPSGAPGIQVTIRGLNFEDVSYVYFGAKRAWEIVMQSDTEIVVEVPPPHGYRGEETVDVVVRETYFGEDSNAVEFTYNEPHLDSIDPEVGDTGTEVTIVGKDFGFDQEYTGHIVEFGCTFQEAEDVPTWTDTKIVAKAPDDYGTGKNNRKLIKWLIWFATLESPKFKIDRHWLDLVLRLLQGCPLLDAEPVGGKIEVGVVIETPVGTSNAAVFTYDLSTTVFVTKSSPGELRVYDSAGRVTGLVNGIVKEEIPHSLFDGDTVVIVSPHDSYRYEVVSTEEGTYGLEVILAEDGEATVFNATGIPTSPNATHRYSVDWVALSLGEEGVTVLIDSDGDGIFEQTITADSELTHDEFMLQTATMIDFDPDTLNMGSKGRWVTVYIELPEGYNVSQIDVSSIVLNGTVPALAKLAEIGDYDDGIPDLMVKFDRAEVIALLSVGEATLTMTGEFSGIPFEGNATIRVIGK